jgi:deoxyribodipyrimidine photolyase
MNELENFIQKRLAKYSSDRNNPLKDGLSKLSPWLHFGEYEDNNEIFLINTHVIFRSDISSKMYFRSK